MRTPISLAAAIAGALLAPGIATAAPTLYVDAGSLGGGCQDARPASAAADPATPWCSLGRAIAAAPAGSTVIVRPATYPELRVSGGRRTSPLVIRGQGNPAPTVDGIEVIDTNLLRFEGLRFTDDVRVQPGTAGIEFVGNEFVGNGIFVRGSSAPLIERNHIHDLPPATDGGSIGIRIMSDYAADPNVPTTGAVIRGNLVERLHEDPIQLGHTEGTLVEGNTLRDAQPTDLGEHTDAIQVLGGKGITLRSNTISHVAHGLMFTTFPVSDVTIENNLVTGINKGYGLNTTDLGMSGLRVVNNTIFDTRYGAIFRSAYPGSVVRNNIFDRASGAGRQPVAEHNLIAVPVGNEQYGASALFGAPGFGAGYELAPGSRAIDAGTVAGAPATDRLGQSRWDDPSVPNAGGSAGIDLGANERQDPSPATTTPGSAPANAKRRKARRFRLRVRAGRRGRVVVRFRRPPNTRFARMSIAAKRPSGRRFTRSSVGRMRRARPRFVMRTGPLRAGTRVTVRLSVGGTKQARRLLLKRTVRAR